MVIPFTPVKAPPVATFNPVEVTENVPAALPMVVLEPEVAAKVALPFCSKAPERVVVPVTPSVPPTVALLVTPSVPPTVSFPDAASEVNAPVEGVVAPIGMLLSEPPVIVALDELKLLAVVAPFRETAPVPVPNVPVPDCRKFPETFRLVKEPAAAVVPPIIVPSIVLPVNTAPDEWKLFAVVEPVKVFVPAPLWV